MARHTNYFRINNKDFSYLVGGMKVGYETLVADGSGRNANGDTVLDIINHKYKLYMKFVPMGESDMQALLNAIQDYVVNVTFYDPRTNSNKTITCYTGTPEPDVYSFSGKGRIYKEFNFNFIEM